MLRLRQCSKICEYEGIEEGLIRDKLVKTAKDRKTTIKVKFKRSAHVKKKCKYCN